VILLVCVDIFCNRSQESTVLHNSNINNKGAKSAAFMPSIQGSDVADVDMEGPGTAEVAEAMGVAEDEATMIIACMSLMESM
jgi:hypothetical protein